MNKLNVFVAFAFFVFLPNVSSASVIVNEIMYDVSGTDSGREWVEVYNNGSDSVDLTGWKFLESVSASNHGLTAVYGSLTLPAGGFAIISNDTTKFLVDWPIFSGNLLKASFASFNNTSGTLLLKDNTGTVIDQTTYDSSMGASGDGNSLQKSGSSWISALPTPGAINSTTSSTPISDNDNSDTATSTTTTSNANSSSSGSQSYSSVSSYASVNIPKEVVLFNVNAGRNRFGSVGDSFAFRAVVEKSEGLMNPTFFAWSFGDGTTATGQYVAHSYEFPGEYVVVLNANSGGDEAVAEAYVQVVVPNIFLSPVISDYVEVWNKSSNEINLNGWILKSGRKSFTFPKDTIILGGHKTIFPLSVIKLPLALGGVVSIYNALGNGIASAYILGLDSTSSSASMTTLERDVALKEVGEKLAFISGQIKNLKLAKGIVDTPSPVFTSSKSPLTVNSTVPPDDLINSEQTLRGIDNSSQTASVGEIFEVKKSDGIVTEIMSVPTKVFSFIKRLFISKK